MKNQYFGNIYDYLKYGLLRQLSRHGQISTAICWMLTKDDGKQEGHRIHYLNEPDKWGKFDPEVFNFLQQNVLEQGLRKVTVLENSQLIPNSRFYSGSFPDHPTGRRASFEEFLKFALGSGLVFFNPDKGIEIKSVKYGRKFSSNYLYWAEIKQSFARGYTLLIYQHLPPKPREQFINTLTGRLSNLTGASIVYSISTGRVAFFLVPQASNLSFFQENVAVVEKLWTGVVKVRKHEILEHAEHLGPLLSPLTAH